MSDTSFFGLVLPGWLLNAGGLVLLMAALWIVIRGVLLRTHERLRCPVKGRMAHLTLLRGPDGSLADVLHCSLIKRRASFAECGKRCLRSAHA